VKRTAKKPIRSAAKVRNNAKRTGSTVLFKRETDFASEPPPEPSFLRTHVAPSIPGIVMEMVSEGKTVGILTFHIPQLDALIATLAEQRGRLIDAMNAKPVERAGIAASRPMASKPKKPRYTK
jgi:hypothetical protein